LNLKRVTGGFESALKIALIVASNTTSTARPDTVSQPRGRRRWGRM